MRCCVKCFHDCYVVDIIKEQGEIDKCDFCGAEEVETLEATELQGVFEQPLGLYEPAEAGTHYIVGDSANDPDFNYEGCSLAERMEQEDGWGIFSDNLSMKQQNDLLDEIRFGGISPKEQTEKTSSSEWWSRKEDRLSADSDAAAWSDFAYHIKRKRRFLPKPEELEFFSDPVKWLPALLEDIRLDILPEKIFYRARIGVMNRRSFERMFGPLRPLPAEEMSAPLSEMAPRGRANPAGIAYLYLADEEKTAVAEIRPFVGAMVTVATLHSSKKLCVVDLTKKHFVETPFGHENLEAVLKRNALLNALNMELARPVNPDDGEVEYVPTQYLAEVVLNSGYDGIRYKSAVTADGTNLVFFSPSDFAIDPKTKLVTIQSMQIEYRELITRTLTG